MEINNNKEEKGLRIKIAFDTGSFIIVTTTENVLNDIKRLIGNKYGRQTYILYNDDGFVCAFIPNKITYFGDMSMEE